jgi:hypothetical protein
MNVKRQTHVQMLSAVVTTAKSYVVIRMNWRFIFELLNDIY